jgi:lysylphosphatidylglycerol synthetase-like protein (DUF2156 family)
MHALSDDPWRLLWAEDRTAFLPFHDLTSSLIAWRDPVGPAERADSLMVHFQAYAASRGKHAVLLGVSQSAAEAIGDCGFQSV